MLYLFVKAGLSGINIAIVSEVARKNPGFGALIASLPLVSILGMVWLWRERGILSGSRTMPRRPSGSCCPVCPCSCWCHLCYAEDWLSGRRSSRAAR